jgi:hypothetical protein
MQRAAQRGVVAKFRIADDGGDGDTGRADLAQQGQGQPPLLLKLHVRGNLCAPALRRRQPRRGEVEPRAQEPGAGAGPERDGHRHLAIRDLAQRPTILPRDADRRRALFRKARAVED